tara:strand:+ start:264 stop:473 length:210 start_codon:yes stop_codon:yes gene_type:complete
MKLIILITSLIFLSNCSSNSVVKLGKKCTKIASDNTYEKSFIWIVDKKNINDFNGKINKENCKINGEKS